MKDQTPPAKVSKPRLPEAEGRTDDGATEVRVRRVNRRDLPGIWEFLKLVFRDVNRETVEFQRPRSKQRFLEIYEEAGIDQLVFTTREHGRDRIVAYAECAHDIVGGDSWVNKRFFKNREMRPFFVEELAVHPDFQGRGLGTFVLEQLEHLAKLNGCTHLVLEVAENNKAAHRFYRMRSFTKLDAAIFMAKPVQTAPELLPPRRLPQRKT
jgi:ribosomal protein S18 acetylase RimI-like enzyme